MPKQTCKERLVIRQLGRIDYEATWRAMAEFTERRNEHTPDELWLLEHPPLFTLGRAGRMQHLRNPGAIPVVRSDRGGQVAYHGPGQLIAYPLLDLQRRKIGIRPLVSLLENAVIALLAAYGVNASACREAPGVYVDGAKIAALGLRIRNGKSLHGLSLNVAMDLSPFARIDPCGYPGLQVTQMNDLIDRPCDMDQIARQLACRLAEGLGCTGNALRWSRESALPMAAADPPPTTG